MFVVCLPHIPYMSTVLTFDFDSDQITIKLELKVKKGLLAEEKWEYW